jgi:hypothetical protein
MDAGRLHIPEGYAGSVPAARTTMRNRRDVGALDGKVIA